jgi:uncharacterized membrane protein
MGLHHDAPAPPLPRPLLAVVTGLVVAAAVGVLVGVVALWPRSAPEVPGGPLEMVEARARTVTLGPCEGTRPEDGVTCTVLVAEVTSGPPAGREVTVQLLPGSGPEVRPGDQVRLAHDVEADVFVFMDLDRTTLVTWLTVAFVVAVVALGRWRGVGALAGLAVSVAVIVGFVVPALLDGQPPLAVALVATAGLAIVTIYLAHGISVRSTTAVLSTLAALALTGLLSVVALDVARFTGLADEAAVALAGLGGLDPAALLLAGIVIGALGVLDDVTVTQVSAVWELRAAGHHHRRELFGAALRIGRDHVSSAVNTLALAYAGAALPLLLLFRQTGRSLSEVATGEVVAIEIVRTLVGSLGLVAAVPIATALGAALATAASVPDDRADGEASTVGHEDGGVPFGHMDQPSAE